MFGFFLDSCDSDGLNEMVLEKMKDTVETIRSGLVDPNAECLICYEAYQVGEQVARLNCLCCFHWECIQAWFNKHGKQECPVHLFITNNAFNQQVSRS
jgi:hypothetical protein